MDLYFHTKILVIKTKITNNIIYNNKKLNPFNLICLKNRLNIESHKKILKHFHNSIISKYFIS